MSEKRPVQTEPEIVLLNRIRAITAERMALSAQSVPRTTLLSEADLTEAVHFRREPAREFEERWDANLSIDVLLARASGIALPQYPDFNKEWTDGALRRDREVNVALVIQAEAWWYPWIGAWVRAR